MLPLRLSVRTVTITVMLAAVAVAAALAYVLYVSDQGRVQTNDRVKLEIAQIARYEDVQIALANQGSYLATYYAIRADQYAQSFEQARAQADQALVAARAAAPSLGAAELARADDLLGRYRNVSDAEERVLQAVQRDDIAGAFAITGQTDLINSSSKLTRDVQQTVTDARAALSAAQRQDATAQRRSFAFSLGIAITWAAFLFLLGLATFRWLVRPLEKVSLTTQAIAGGDLSARVPEAGPRELANVGGDVNRMAEALIRRSDELNAYLAKDLEARTGQLEARTEELEASEQRFRALVQHGSDLITVIEPDGTISYQSPSIERVLGYAAPDIVGRKLTELTHPDDVHRVASFITDAMKLHGATTSAAVRLRALDGAWVHVEIAGTDHRDDAAVRGLVLNIRDVSERQALEEQLRFEAFHDPLTQLANRAQFTDRLAHALDRRIRRATQLAVLFLDLDNFKSVNDSLGHAAGDALLTEAGRRLQTCTRPEDTVARLGGDEFAVLLEDVASIDEASEAARRILSALRTPVRIEGRQVVAPASIGIAIGAGETDAGVLLRNADVAMYAAKALGKNRYEVYEPSMHAAALDRLDLAGDLAGAVERGEFVLEYQPILTLASGEVAGVEALVRWNHPTRGQIQPDGFISLAEETGAIIELGRWVLGEACRQACAWYDEFTPEPPFAMNVNVSARQLLYPGFVNDVVRALRECPIEPGSLVLEITESVMMRDTQASLAILRELKGLGVRLAIDDFGTGYSSLGYLRQFPFDILKIDRSYLATGGEHSNDQDLERAIVDLGRTLKLEIVAEGVEQAEQLVRLKSLHCELGQGFYFARPMAPDKIREVLLERRDRRYAA